MANVTVDSNGMATVPTPANDYEKHLKILQQRTIDVPYSSANQGDSFRAKRTLTVLLWIFSNAVLVATVFYVPSLSVFEATADGGKGFIYVGVVLWTNVGLLATQYFGTLIYYITRAIMWVLRRPRRNMDVAS